MFCAKGADCTCGGPASAVNPGRQCSVDAPCCSGTCTTNQCLSDRRRRGAAAAEVLAARAAELPEGAGGGTAGGAGSGTAGGAGGGTAGGAGGCRLREARAAEPQAERAAELREARAAVEVSEAPVARGAESVFPDRFPKRRRDRCTGGRRRKPS